MLDAPHVTLAHGNGGRRMRELIEDLFARHFANPHLDVGLDAARLPAAEGEAFITTDGFTVQPLEFPGGDIGSLAVNGTVNDLAVSGARPRYLTLGAIIEEGLPLAQLERIVVSAASAARAAGVEIVAGDTKVVPRGQGGGLYLTTTGVGWRPPGRDFGMKRIRAGDVVLVSGPVGDHGVSVLLAREDFGLSGSVRSDCASVAGLVECLADLRGLRFMRDPTRGGLATVMHEIAAGAGLETRLDESSIPVRDAVRSVCDMLGYDPLYLACEGRVVAIVAPDEAGVALARWRAQAGGERASIMGRLSAGPARVLMETSIGGERFLEELEDDPLPRIC